MLVAERRNTIKQLLFKKGSVKVSELVQLFNVSEETIRRDLNELEYQGLVEKNYGGAILIDQGIVNETIPHVDQRKYQYSEEKDSIGKRAAELVKSKQIIIFDAGSTTWYAASHLKNVENITVISNGINIVEECSKNETASIHSLGGELRRNSMSVIGPQAQSELLKYNADIVFLGTSGISLRHGFTSSDLYEAEIKQAMVSAGRKIVMLADHSKLNKAGLVSFCNFDDVDLLITSELADQEVVKKLRAAGLEVDQAPLLNH
ncbi:DeoR/GlpR family DNA-binding transcription regulator [Neobacillus sp. DY30]|uniref:DeoR/GlpR family DNA-binding transcription regulator n=1 Tax=Neobacillus sp. DY30 TaxID=3047871 RepID=UPI0024C0822D|nr:DeoR/GlpR family DNA-binding transcription regulator [Neobacillus sp. DY30]WHX98102.1 DeoR/GlpR family DNA-binding transcription regulator [Neobacillus sp. DY30]